MSVSTNIRNDRIDFMQSLKNIGQYSGLIFGVIISVALLFFELFNYSTTDFALRDLLGDLKFAGIAWATTLSVAFCAIDFAGIARLFMPDESGEEQRETWYLFGAWLMAATMNAVLTWWGVSMAVSNHTVQSNSVVNPETIQNIVPLFVAILVWLIRIMLIGSISMATNHFVQDGTAAAARTSPRASRSQPQTRRQTARASAPSATLLNSTRSARPAGTASRSAVMSPSHRPTSRESQTGYSEPTYMDV
jgi:hypothetical protein